MLVCRANCVDGDDRLEVGMKIEVSGREVMEVVVWLEVELQVRISGDNC